MKTQSDAKEFSRRLRFLLGEWGNACDRHLECAKECEDAGDDEEGALHREAASVLNQCIDQVASLAVELGR